MKNTRSRDEMESILLKIREIVKQKWDRKKINFAELKEEILKFTESDLKMTEEELNEIFDKYDKVLFGGEYHRFLEQEKFESKLLDWIKTVVLEQRNSRFNKNMIKEEVRYYVNDIESKQQISQELLEKYDIIFDKQYEKYLEFIEKYENLILHYIKKEHKNTLISEKDSIKEKVGRRIQALDPHSASQMSFSVEEIFENYDWMFDYIYNKMLVTLNNQQIKDIRPKSEKAYNSDLATSENTMETIRQKREAFLSSIRPPDNKQTNNLEGSEKNDKELAYTTIIQGEQIFFHNRKKKIESKEDPKSKKAAKSKEIQIMKFMETGKIMQYPNTETPKREDGGSGR